MSASEPEIRSSDIDLKEHAEAHDGVAPDHGGPLRGQKFVGGKYRILELLGTGGMGAVYKVKHEMLDQVFAIKVLERGTDADQKVIRRFDQEAKSAGALKHENLCGVHDYGITDDGVIYIVMDYLEGTGLDQEIKRLGKVDEKRAIDIFIALCNGLAHAHSKGIIHRDLKPSNVMLVRDEHGREVPKIVDFGIAKRQQVDTKLTQTGELFGTPLYMSPEQCMGYELDARSDIYSLGCVMFETLSGSNPFVADNAMQVIMKHVQGEVPSFKPTDHVSAAMRLVVSSCLEKDVGRRPGSAELLRNNLELARQGKLPSAQSMLSRVRRKHIYWAIDAILLFAIGHMLVKNAPGFVEALTTPTSLKMAGEINNLLRTGEYTEAAQLADKAAAIAGQKHLNAKQRTELYQSIYSAFEYANQDEKASNAAAVVVESAKTIGSPSMAVKRLIPKYEFYAARNITTNPQQALAYLSDMAEREREWAGKNPTEFADDLYGAGQLAAITGHEKEAIPYFKQAFDLRTSYEKQRPDLAFTSSVWLTSAYIHEHEFTAAKEPLEVAEKLMPQIVSLKDKPTWEHRVRKARELIDKHTQNR